LGVTTLALKTITAAGLAAPAPREQAAADQLIRIAGEALPPDLAHLAAGPMATARAKAVDFAQASVSSRTERIYADTWAAFRDWCDAHKAPARGRRAYRLHRRSIGITTGGGLGGEDVIAGLEVGVRRTGARARRGVGLLDRRPWRVTLLPVWSV
jgi:hypothetical protein